MKIKVCGMNEVQNILEVAKLAPDYMGFIFYEKSPRFINKEANIQVLQNFPSIQKVAVFVNASLSYIEEKVTKHHFSHLQLHGNESVDFCKKIKNSTGKKIIKAFGVFQNFDFSITIPYQNEVDYILFDTKTSRYGGSGDFFAWDLLKNYNNKLPIFLSGGLTFENIQKAAKIDFVNIHALDLNSRFEKSPALKNVELLKLGFSKIR